MLFVGSLISQRATGMGNDGIPSWPAVNDLSIGAPWGHSSPVIRESARGASPDRFDRISLRLPAYDPFGDGRTSIRAGYGIFSDTLRPVALNTNQTNQPFSYGWTTFDVPLSNPYVSNQPTLQLLLNYVPPTTAAARQARVFYLPMPENSINPNSQQVISSNGISTFSATSGSRRSSRLIPRQQGYAPALARRTEPWRLYSGTVNDE